MKKKPKIQAYDHLIENIADWPIYKLSEDRKAFVEEIDNFTLQRFLAMPNNQVSDILARAIYLERIRVKEEPWKVDPPKEKSFWNKLQRKLASKSLDQQEDQASKINEEILRSIVHRYSEEIVGTFRIKTFLFARRFLTMLFTRLLNTAASKYLYKIFGSRYRLLDKLRVEGEVDKMRSLFNKGTVVIVPTHFSNLDSIIIGYAMDAFAGLPSFSYGAGLNLYNSGFVAYFINRMGAYRIDRRKKNAIYLETLKTMSNLSIQRGTNSLFFPGGTRSRSGMLEDKLKLGLLSTVVEAQRGLYEKGKDEKIFIVPLILGYHFVLEAKFLIEQHLRKIGKEHYIKARDGSYSRRKNLKFIWRLFSESNDIILSVGQPMDVLGNPVNAEGVSLDKRGNPIEVKDYFISQNSVKADIQRDSEYTKLLGEKIVEAYHKDNIVLSSHLVAFAAFELLKVENSKLDLYGILRLPVDDYIFDIDVLREVIQSLTERLIQMEAEGNIKLSAPIIGSVDDLIQDGVKRLGTFHAAKPLKFNKQGDIVSQSFKLLYYYHNRLEHYDLDKVVKGSRNALRLEVIS